MMLIKIFLIFMMIGSIAIGGGYGALPIFENYIVKVYELMTYQEFADMLAIDELTPGPIAINIATFVGTKLTGVLGGIVASIGVIIPGCIFSLILLKLYRKYKELKAVDGALSGLRSMVVAMISSTALTFVIRAFFGSDDLIINNFDFISLILFIIALIVFRKTKISPAIVIIGCGLIGLFIYPFI